MTQTATRAKIFGIGLNKTGTTTLGQCGKILGYNCTGFDRDLLKEVVIKKNFTRIEQTVRKFDLFEDWPWPLIYEELDHLFPGSKFILTTRKNENIWFESLKNYSMTTPPIKHCRKLAYGYSFPHRHKQHHLEFYKTHNKNVRRYFEGRDDDFLEICWENDDGFSELCTFLGCAIPKKRLPHANKGKNKRVRKSRLLINKVLSLF